MASDKKISDLPVASTISANDNSILIKNGTDYQFAFETLLQFISSELAVGANITFGVTLPPNSMGKNGDVFINTNNGSFAQKLANIWTVVYTLPQGNNTTDGTVLYGNSNPGSSTGSNNDTYINTATGIFFKKSAGAWSQVFSMQTGPAGPRGNSVLNGSVDPTAAIGQNGDFYYNTATQYIFGPKSTGSWPTGVRMKGANGNTVLHGSANPSNLTDGVDGDFYINTTTYSLFGPKQGDIWPVPIALVYDPGYTPENPANKNQPNGYAGLDSSGKVTSSQLPSYIDDVLEFTSYAALPLTGETGKIYVTLDTNFEYRWSGSTYIQLVASPGSTDNVPEGATNKYFTAARAIAAALTGLGVGDSSAVTAADSIVSGIGKLQAQINALPSGGSDYTLPVATPSVLGGVKQGSGVLIHPDGKIDADVKETVFRQTGSIPVHNVTVYENYGDSIANGSFIPPSFSYMNQIRGHIPALVNDRAYGGSGALWAVTAANRYIPIGVGNYLLICLVGINDLRNRGGQANTLSKISTCIDALIANAMLSEGATITGSSPYTTKTGTWDTVDTSIYGGKSSYFQYNPLGAKSTAAGSTLSTDLFGSSSELVIGTFTDDGQSENALGAFEVHLLDQFGNATLVTTFDPYNKNDGYVSSPDAVPPARQGRMPAVIRIKGTAYCTLKIVTLSNTETIIDYIGVLNTPSLCSPVIISLIPYATDAVLAGSIVPITRTDIDNANALITDIISGWAGFPVCAIDPNTKYDPNTMSVDGLHPNYLGQTILADLFMSKFLGGSKPYTNPHIDQLINGIPFGQGPQTNPDTNQYGVVIGKGANAVNVSGSDNVIIGGSAGSTKAGGNINSQVCIGKSAGGAANGGGIFIGRDAGGSINNGAYGQVVIGLNAQPPHLDDNNVIMIQSSEQNNRVLIDSDGFSIKASSTPPVSATGVASTHKIPFTYNGVAGFLLWSNV